MKDKRIGKKKATEKDEKWLGKEVTVQRISTEVSGKAQKYARVGPREFVKIVACNNDDEEDDEEEIDLIKYVVSSSSVPSHSPKKAKIYTPVPQSISIIHILQLGKVVQKQHLS